MVVRYPEGQERQGGLAANRRVRLAPPGQDAEVREAERVALQPEGGLHTPKAACGETHRHTLPTQVNVLGERSLRVGRKDDRQGLEPGDRTPVRKHCDHGRVNPEDNPQRQRARQELPPHHIRQGCRANHGRGADRVLRQLQGNHLRQENGVLLRCGIIPEPVGNIHQQEGKRIKPLQPPDQVAAQHGGPVGIKVKPRLR